MLYHQLQRVSQLDRQINDLHLRLSEYYRERALILQAKSAVSPSPAIKTVTDVAKVRPLDTHVLYDQLKTFWDNLGIKLPTYTSLERALTLVTGAVATFQTKNPELIGHLSIVAVPPQRQLEKLMENSKKLPHQYTFTDEFIQNSATRNKGWGLVIVTSPEFKHPVVSIEDTQDENQLKYKQFNSRGLGFREIVAADIQGVPVLGDDEWTLLLKDADDEKRIPCVTRRNDRVVFDIEDGSYLLGNNYVQPTLALG